MALGGGNFLTQNKVLPGAYINFVSASKASANLSDRGYVSMPLELDWGVDNEIFEVTNEDFQKESLKIFGYDYTHEKLKGLRDLFLNAKTLYAYKLTSGGVKASNTFCTAKYCGIRGNDLKTIIQKNLDKTVLAHYEECESSDEGALEVIADDGTVVGSQIKIGDTGLTEISVGDYVVLIAEDTYYDVSTYIGTLLLDTQTVKLANELESNDYVDFKTNATLSITAGTNLTNGTNGTVNGTSYQNYLDKIEPFSFNVMGVVSTDETIKSLMVSFCKRMRDEVGVKFQLVIHNKQADYEGVINVANEVEIDSNFGGSALVYWITGLEGNCAVNKSCLNKKYTGEFIVNVDYKQSQLEAGILAGKFMLHAVGTEIRVLSDINSFVSTTDEKGADFQSNQTIRVCDQIANDIAVLFNTKYLGECPNDSSGRISLWADIVKHHEELQKLRAIENFADADVTVSQGDTKKAVVVSDYITVVNAMGQLYMTVKVA